MRKIISDIFFALLFAFVALGLGATFLYDNIEQGATFALIGVTSYIIHTIIKPRQ